MSVDLICPVCKNDVNMFDEYLQCIDCNNNYSVNDGIPQMFIPTDWNNSKNDVTEIVNQFYEDTPFPDYEDMEEINDLVTKSEMGYYAKFLNEQIPFNVNVLEVGCGTGQLANYLGLATRNVVGTDMCFNSLRLAEAFRYKHKINNVKF